MTTTTYQTIQECVSATSMHRDALITLQRQLPKPTNNVKSEQADILKDVIDGLQITYDKLKRLSRLS